jgi:hypothetical protein
MHSGLYERIYELEKELAALKSTEVINDTSAVRKALVCAYGKKKFIKEGWDDNVVAGRIERTYGADDLDCRPDVYFILYIQTKTMKIKLEYENTYENDHEHDYGVYVVNDDGSETQIIYEPPGNDFERRLIKMMQAKPPIFIEQFDE